ncbi:hypothetical protein [Flavobacterium terrisoli]|uniref:hypothetical protein n=1 Tax=Flavobacterium terrisoli TaxID=3242195 RepID=UPI0025439E5D|nr:hypothetical protein [Flavobacterium buctense]
MISNIKKERVVYISVLIIILALLLIERLTAVEINNNIILFLIVFTTIGTLSLIVSQYLFGELSRKYVILLFLIVFSVCLAVAVLTWADNWKTQSILYRNTKHPQQTIEYRMRSKHGYGFEKQIVRRKRILPYLDNIIVVDTTAIDKSKWIRVNEMVNEMGIPGDYVNLPDN